MSKKSVPPRVAEELKRRGLSLDRDGFLSGLREQAAKTAAFGNQGAKKIASSHKNEDTDQKEGFSIIQAGGAKFGLLSELGKGAFSRVKYAQNGQTGEWVAVKIEMLDFHGVANNPEKNGKKKYPTAPVTRAKANNQSEAEALASWKKRMAQEKAITQTYVQASMAADVHGEIRKKEVNGKPYYKSYLFVPLGADDLSSKLEKNVLNEEQATKLAENLLKGLMALDKTDIVHDDIKSSNIILFDDGSAQLSDFGGAHQNGAEEASFESIYTKKYAAPERLLEGGNKNSSHASDMYSMGLVLAEIYGIQVKYDSPRTWLHNGKETGPHTHFPAKPSHLKASEEMKALIQWMTASNPMKRPNAMQALDAFHKMHLTVEAKKIPGLTGALFKSPSLAKKDVADAAIQAAQKATDTAGKTNLLKASTATEQKDQGNKRENGGGNRQAAKQSKADTTLQKIANACRNELNRPETPISRHDWSMDTSALAETGKITLSDQEIPEHDKLAITKEGDPELSALSFNWEKTKLSLDQQHTILAKGFYAAWKQIGGEAGANFSLGTISPKESIEPILKALAKEAIKEDSEFEGGNQFEKLCSNITGARSTDETRDLTAADIKEIFDAVKLGHKPEDASPPASPSGPGRNFRI